MPIHCSCAQHGSLASKTDVDTSQSGDVVDAVDAGNVQRRCSASISTGRVSNMLKLAHLDFFTSGRQDEVLSGYIGTSRCG
jgi:hypothetical protein